MRILSFDISSVKTGYCLFNKGRLIKSSLGLITTKSKDCLGKRLADFRKEMICVIRKYKPNIIVCEEIFKGRNINTFKILACFRGVAIQTIYEEIGKDPVSIMAAEARSTIGIGKSKEEAFDAVIDKYSLELDFEQDNDLADAIVLGLATHTLLKQGTDERSLQRTRRKKRSKRRRNKKSV